MRSMNPATRDVPDVLSYSIEFEQEVDGRWIAEIAALPGVMVYGATKEEAASKVEALALRVLADRLERDHATLNTLQFA